MHTVPIHSTKPLRILLLEDDNTDAELVTNELQRSGMTVMIGRVDCAESFTAALHSFTPDIVLSDHSLDEFGSLAALEIVRAVRPTAPFIIIAGSISGAQSVAAMRAGREDIVLKSCLNRLGASISNALAVRRTLHTLTARQIQVLRMVAEGYRTRDIAKRLGLSAKTVESHRGELMKRLSVHDVVSLVRYALRVGLIASNYQSLERVT